MSQSSFSMPEVNHAPGIRVLRTLRQWIADGRLPPGECLPPENAMAQQLGVARATLRGALKQLQEEDLLRPHGRRRIVAPAGRTVSTVVSQTVVMLGDCVREDAARRQHGWEQFIQIGISDAIRSAGMHGLLLQMDLLEGEQIHRLISERPRGVIAMRNAIQSQAGQNIIAVFRAAGIPVVGYGHAHELADCDTVASDHASGAYQLARWLLQRGRKQIMRYWYGTWRSSERPAWLAQRDAGYERAMIEAGLTPLPPIEPPTRTLSEGDDFERKVRFVAGYLAEHVIGSKVEALMLASDGLIPVVAGALRLLGKEPNRDVELVGYDNYWIDLCERTSENTQPLATIDKCNMEIGSALVELLLSRLAGKSPPEPQHRLIEPRLVIAVRGGS
jgi:DNA-binding LacI/PurR family transcriptional regulator